MTVNSERSWWFLKIKNMNMACALLCLVAPTYRLISLIYFYGLLRWHYANHTLYRCQWHYDDVIMTMLASQITSLAVVYSIVYSGVDQRKHQSSASLAFVREIHRGPVNFPQKWPVTRKIFPFDDVIMEAALKNMPHMMTLVPETDISGRGK